MLVEESLPTLPPVPGIAADGYVEQSLGRLRNTAIRHRNHQIATDGSQKIVQRLLKPDPRAAAARREHGLLSRRGRGLDGLSRPGLGPVRRALDGGRPLRRPHRAIADRVGSDTAALAAGILAIDAIFDRELAASAVFRQAIVDGLDGLLSADPLGYVRRIVERTGDVAVEAAATNRRSTRKGRRT